MLSKRNVKGRAGAAPAPSPRPAVRCVLRFVAELLRESKGSLESSSTAVTEPHTCVLIACGAAHP